MVSVNPNPSPHGFYLFDPTQIPLPGLESTPPPPPTAATPPSAADTSSDSASRNGVSSEDQSKKIRKPYTITKSRESWTDQEHDKFLEALQLFDRDWKKIEAFVGSKTVIQIRSHAQKYFLKVQKKGTSEHVPPPRPKRKATHPYPQKAPKIAPVASQVAGPFESSSALLDHGHTYLPESSFVHNTPVTSATLSSWSHGYVPPVNASQITKDDGRLACSADAQNSCYSSSNESKPTTLLTGDTVSPACHHQLQRVLPDFAQVYKFIGSVFDPASTNHLEKLKQMDPINLETALLLMRNLSINLRSPEFEDHRKLLSSYDMDLEKGKLRNSCGFPSYGKMESVILST